MRLAPLHTREIGLELFEQLVEIQAYTASGSDIAYNASERRPTILSMRVVTRISNAAGTVGTLR